MFSVHKILTVNGSITVPWSTITGETRMRVSMGAILLTPCGNISYGEVEDYTVDIACNKVGNTDVFSLTSTSPYRRAMPFTMPEDGIIKSVSIYHEGSTTGNDEMVLAVYDGEGSPQKRLAFTPPDTYVSTSPGWQTVELRACTFVSGGSTVWLAWVFESNPGIRYQEGSPGRFQSTDTWSGHMPYYFGAGTQTNYIYSIYANYNRCGCD